MKGRKPKPTALKIIQGNPGKRRLNKSEPQPEIAIPEKPDFLGPDASRKWDELAPKLYRNGMLTELDGDALAAYCVAYGRWVEAERMINEKGMLHVAPNGFIQPSPFLWIANKAWDQRLKQGSDLGLSSSSRSRVSVGSAKQSENRFANNGRRPK